MDYKYININEIKIRDINIDKDRNIVIPILYDNTELSIRIPENNNKYFKISQFENDVFNYYLTLELMEDMDDFEEEYKNNLEELSNQKEAIKFSNFLAEIKDEIIKCFFNKLKINKDYLNMINFNDLNLEDNEIDKAIWNENIDFSYMPEVKEIENKYILSENNDAEDESEENIEIILRHRFHINKITKKEKDLILKCNIIFINKILDDKKHIYIDWNIV